MAMHESEAFWQEFLRRPSAQRAVQLEQKAMMKETALDLQFRNEKETKAIIEALEACDPDVEEFVRQMLGSARAKRLLTALLHQAHMDKVQFKKQLEKGEPAREKLEALRDDLILSAVASEAQFDHVRAEAEKNIKIESYKPCTERTWKDIPEEELTERLCKGEICPRDEWIPGLSKDKRPLDSLSLKQHLALGEQMLRDGREAFAGEKFDIALMRFTQGVQLLNWVRAADTEEQYLVDDMYLTFLRNQALAALRLEKYQECIKACTTIIQDVDEHDAKARYRRAKAYTLLGMVKCAKDDYVFMIKSPFMDAGATLAARLALGEIRRIVSKYKVETRETVVRSTAHDIFSENRQTKTELSSCKTFDEDENIDQTDFYKLEQPCGDPLRRPMPAEKLHNRVSLTNISKHTTSARNESTSVTPATDDQHFLTQEKNQEVCCAQGQRSHQTHRRQWLQENGRSSSDGEEDTALRKTVVSKSNTGEENLPSLTLDETKLLLEDLLDCYTEPDNQKQLQQMVRDADFETRSFLIRVRKYLPQLQSSVFERHMVPGKNHREKLRAVETSVAYWRPRDEEVSQLRKECWAAVFGELLDIDV